MYPDNQSNLAEKSVSVLGIISIIIAIVMGTLIFVVIVIAGYLELNTPGGIDDNSPILALIGVVAIGVMLAHIIGATLGFVGLLQPNKKKLFAAVGAFLNSFILLSVIGLIIFGLLTE